MQRRGCGVSLLRHAIKGMALVEVAEGREDDRERIRAPLPCGAWGKGNTARVYRGGRRTPRRESMVRTLLLILLIVLLLAALPTWPYSSGWGYYPSGTLGLILLIVIILVLVGYL